MTRSRSPFRGFIAPDQSARMSAEARRYWISRGYLPQLAGGDRDQPGAAGQVDPFGFGQDAQNRLVVDDYLNPVTEITQQVADMVAENEFYWITDIYNTPGLTVNSGALRYSESFPRDHFLDPTQDIAPRAPGSEAARIGAPRRPMKTAFAESWAGSLEVHDEIRRWNRTDELQDLFQRTANSFGERLQRSGEEKLAAFVQASNRFIVDTTSEYSDWAAADPVTNTNTTTPRPGREFARVARLFMEDMAGTAPDTVIVDPEDAEAFDNVYEEKGPAVLARHGLTMRVSTRRQPGRRLYVRAGQVGSIVFDKPLGEPEYTREGTRFTDVYTFETTPFFIPRRADAILEVRVP